MADDVTITVHVRDLTGAGFNSVNRNLNQLQRNASSMGASLRIVGGELDDVASSAANAGNSFGGSGGLRAKLIGVAAAAGTTLLPTLGALAPMLTGLSVVGGGAALAMGDLEKKAKQLKPAFEDWKKAAEKAVAPHTERAVKSLKSAMKDLQPQLVLGAETFGSITERAAKFVDSPAFQSAFQKNVQMGVVWVEQFAGSIGKFTQSFLEFGTKSQPALDAWQELLGGFLDTGLPSMFKELEQGIDGSSQMLSGLASFLNEGLLPALGKVAGSFSDAFGPLIGELLRTAGQALLGFAEIFDGAMEGLKPVARIAADALHALTDIMVIGGQVAGSLAKNIGGALVDALLTVSGIDTDGMTGGFTKLSDWVDQNANRIRGVFFDIAHGITTFVTVGLTMLPQLFEGFRWLSESVLDVVGGMLAGITLAFSNLPGMGWLKDVNKEFVEFSSGFRDKLDAAGEGINAFVEEAVPNLNRVQLKLKVDEAEQNLAHIKEQLKDPDLTDARTAELKVEKAKAEEALAAAKRALKDFDGKKATGKIDGNNLPFFGALGMVNKSKVKDKTGNIKANTRPFAAALGGIVGRTVGSAYINVYNRYVDNQAARPFRAMGGPIRRLAGGGAADDGGGRVVGPGSEMSDSVPAMLSAGEFVIRASSVRKYGQSFMEAVNSGQLKVAAFARGGSVSKSEAQARKDTRHLLSVSRFGQMAGWRHSEIRNALGDPGDVKSLVTALSDWRSNIQKATHGRTESNLLRQLDATGKKLFFYQKHLDKASTSLQKSKDRLDELKRAAEQLRDSVKSNVLSSANITKRQGDGPVTVASIMAGLTSSRDKATAFSRALADLRKKGLAGALIEQIGQAGIEGGGLETAGALLRASGSEIKSLNSLQSQITGAAAAAGKTTADAVYAGQIKGQEQLVKAWDRTVKSLKGSMDKLAAAMEKAVERAWASRATGGITGAASGGARGGWTMVGEHAPELVRLPFGSRVYSGPDTRRMQQQAWASMLTTPRDGAPRYAPTPVAASSNQPMLINVNIGGREFGQLWVDTGRREVRALGGLRATLGGDS